MLQDGGAPPPGESCMEISKLPQKIGGKGKGGKKGAEETTK
jgi:hypothetical protein